MTWLDTFLSTPARATMVDGTPLWAYRCTDEEYRTLLDELGQLRRWGAGRGGSAMQVRCFALAGAEALRRGHLRGAWTWDTVREELDLSRISDEDLRNLTATGLRAWNRPLRVEAGVTRYLRSLLVEGGLPLHLLHQEGGRLRSIGSAVLRDLGALSVGAGVADKELEAIAARAAAPYARVAYLREPTIHALLGRLLNVVRLAVHQVPSEHSSDPSAWLATHDPGWLQRLPLDLEAAAAMGLVRALVADASEVRGSAAPPRFHTWLHLGSHPYLRRTLWLPAPWHPRQLRQCFGLSEDAVLPRRLELTVRAGGRPWEVARLSVRDRDEPLAIHDLHASLPSDGLARLDLVGRMDGRPLSPSLLGDRLPEEPPWVFGPGHDGALRLLGVGSVSHPAAELVVVTRGATPSSGEHLGKLGDGRSLVRVVESTDFEVDGESYRVQPRGQLCEETALRFSGRRHELSPPDEDVWVGLPTPQLVLASGAVRAVPTHRLRVRRQGGTWVPWGHLRSGSLSVQFPGTACGGTIVVAPESLRVVVESGPHGGRIAVFDEGAADLAIHTPPLGFHAQRVGIEAGAAQDVRVTGQPPLELDVEVILHSGARIPLRVPFPREHAGFQDSRTREQAEEYGLDDLPWLHAVRVSALQTTAALVGRLCWEGVPVPAADLAVPIPSVDAGSHVHQLSLGRARESIEALLLRRAGRQASVRLSVADLGHPQPARGALVIRRYRHRLEVDEGLVIRLPKSLSSDDSVTVEALRLDCRTDAVRLPRLHPGPRAFVGDLPTGDWLVVARREGSVVAAPLWARRIEQGGLELFDGVAPMIEAPPADVAAALRAQAALLASGVFAGHLPALRALPDSPYVASEVLRGALAVGDPTRACAAVADGLERLPFLWASTPLEAWVSLVEQLWEDLAPLRAVNSKLARDQHQVLLRAVMAALPHTVHAASAWYKRHTPTDPFSDRQDRQVVHLADAGFMRAFFDREVDDLRRRTLDRPWPCFENGRCKLEDEAAALGSGRHLRRLIELVPAAVDEERPLLHAPLFAALVTWRGVPLPPLWRSRLLDLRQFDEDWFEMAHRLALAYLAREAK